MPRQLPRRALLSAAAGAALGGCTPLGGNAGPPPGATPTAAPPSSTVLSATGPVAVSATPLRVVVLDTAELDSVMTLGITPVGGCRAAEDQGLPDYWPASRLAEVPIAGTVGDPDFARIRALRPQLILSSQLRDGGHYEALRAIAPTVLSQTTGYPWKANFHLHAQALGRLPEATAIVTAYQGLLAQVSRALGGPAAASGRRVSLVRFVQGGRIRLYGRQNFLGTLLADLQLGRPAAQNVDQFDVEITPDQLGGADGDILLYATYGDPVAAGTTATLASPGWQALGAVRAHRAFPVDDQLWFQGIGYNGAEQVLAQLQCLLGA
ncbi:iron complex transport system substrate-binding protein [Kitasatospora sp. MAP12-15]|uniref:iron-siderophore ABC transporter substrate-binding protein n=1 Tax=unclassified Kitasatospora TaxID=2633591 RepID=UPI0024746EDA|nr:iron-siderophore ABC transporter substrate-binding protein [Kitasatospora sp. MAP12-44]MDH6112282.1 iron complex transport system substrate-binding protein [Kitasatospora sp. MAP12-44]